MEDVKISVKNRMWKAQKPQSEKINELMSCFGISDFLANFIINREVGKTTEIEDFLSPKIKNLMPDPNLIMDMEKGIELLLSVVKKNGIIGIIGDYDVDGACSVAILKEFLLQIGVRIENIKIQIPNREKDGYGPNLRIINQLLEDKVDLIFSVDCGIVSFEPIDHAKNNNCSFIILDHHKPSEKLPNADAVINPNRFDDKSELDYLCGAGVVFMFCVGMSKKMNQPELKEFLLNSIDIITIATICDIVPLVKLNRAIVTYGLQRMNQHPRAGINAIMEVKKSTAPINARTIGFQIGPLINACGRVGDPNVASLILTEKSKQETFKIAEQMNEWNLERIKIEKSLVRQIKNQISETIKSNNQNEESFIFLYNKQWHQGVIGIVSSRTQETYNKVAIIGSLFEESGKEYIKASCRSIKGVDIGKIVLKAVDSKIAINGGGHYFAAGFTMLKDKVKEMQNLISSEISKMLNKNELPFNEIDFCISPNGIGSSLLQDLSKLEPFGSENREVVFGINNVTISRYEIIKEEHIRLTLKSRSSNSYIQGMCFRSIGTELEKTIRDANDKSITVDIVCNIQANHWRGKVTPTVVIFDIIL